MSTSNLSRWLVAAVTLLVGSEVRADGEIPFTPRLAGTISNGQQQLETGLEYQSSLPDDATKPGPGDVVDYSKHVYVSLTVPFNSGTVVRIDKNTSEWTLNAGFDLIVRHRVEPEGVADARQRMFDYERYGVTVSGGHSDFEFYPNAGMDKSDQSHWSWAASVHGFWMRHIGGRRLAPQLAVTYDRSFNAAPKVGVETPATMDTPALVVRNVAIAPPTAQPALTARLSVPFVVDPALGISVGPSIAHSFSGPDRAYVSFGDAGRFEAELWIYYFIKAPEFGSTNARVGVAPFVSQRTYGDDGGDTTSFGALAELRISNEIFAY